MSDFTLCAFADEAGAEMVDQIKALKENQIGYLELRGIGTKNVSSLTIGEAIELQKQLEAEKIAVWSIGSPIGKINITEDFAPHMEQFMHTLEVAQIMRASCIRLFSFYIPEGEDTYNRYRDDVLNRLTSFCDAAKGSGITLCHENEKGIYGDFAARCLEIHQNVKELKAIFDPANFVQCGQSIPEAWALLAPYIHYLHIKDALKEGSIVPAGHGDGQIKELLEMYKAQKGKMITLEPHLAIFSGLEELEHGEKSAVGGVTYPSQRFAFDHAADALKQLI